MIKYLFIARFLFGFWMIYFTSGVEDKIINKFANLYKKVFKKL